MNKSQPKPTDLEILRHPLIDILKLLVTSDHDAYRLMKELGIGIRACYNHLKVLDAAGLIGFCGYKCQISQAGRELLSRHASRIN